MPVATPRVKIITLHKWDVPKKLSVSSYLRSLQDRARLQREAKGTTSGPTGAEVDAQVASTLSRKQGADALKGLHLEAQVDDKGRVLGLEDPNDPQLQDDPETFPNGRPEAGAGFAPKDVAVARPPTTNDEVSPELFEKVHKATGGRQKTIRFFETPHGQPNAELVDPAGEGFVDPRVYGGSNFDLVGNGQHEPLNVIISGNSSPDILTRKGFQGYCRSLDFDKQCLGLHAGAFQKGWTDPRGWRDQEFLYREVYTPFDHVFGTCIESLIGGNHIRAWQQQGTGAWFLAASSEMDATKNHMIIPDGYNIGRDKFVMQSQKEKDGITSFFFTKYKTTVEYVGGLMPPGIEGVNHDIPVDGLSAILTVTILNSKNEAGAKAAQEPEGQLQQTSEASDGGAAVGDGAEAHADSDAVTALPNVNGNGTASDEPRRRRRSLVPKKLSVDLGLNEKTREWLSKVKSRASPTTSASAKTDEAKTETGPSPTTTSSA